MPRKITRLRLEGTSVIANPFDGLRINSVTDLSPVLFSKERAKGTKTSDEEFPASWAWLSLFTRTQSATWAAD
jgi:hypothetical protein